MPVRVTRGALVAHRYTFAPPRCRTSQYRRTFIPLSVSLWNDLVTPYSMVRDWRVPRIGIMTFYWPCCSLPYCLLLFFVSLPSFYWLVLWGWGLRTDKSVIALSQPFIANFKKKNNSKIPRGSGWIEGTEKGSLGNSSTASGHIDPGRTVGPNYTVRSSEPLFLGPTLHFSIFFCVSFSSVSLSYFNVPMSKYFGEYSCMSFTFTCCLRSAKTAVGPGSGVLLNKSPN